MEERIIETTEKSIKKILDEGITSGNLEHLYKLSKIKHIAKEDKDMNNNYGNYGNYSGRNVGYDSYGRNSYGDNYGNYGRRGIDRKYRGHEHLERMYDDYGRYEEGKQRYGANEDTKKSLKYMLESMEDFARMLREEATSQEEVQMIKNTAQRIANM